MLGWQYAPRTRAAIRIAWRRVILAGPQTAGEPAAVTAGAVTIALPLAKREAGAPAALGWVDR